VGTAALFYTTLPGVPFVMRSLCAALFVASSVNTVREFSNVRVVLNNHPDEATGLNDLPRFITDRAVFSWPTRTLDPSHSQIKD